MNYFHQESKRLIFRKLTESDIPSWLEFFEDNDHLRFLGMDLSKDKSILAREWVLSQLKRYKTQGLGHLAAIEKSTGTFIGMSGILPRTIQEKEEYEIAYSLKPTFWRKGYGTEMAQQMKQFGMENKLSKRFISIIHKENLGSAKVAENNGMIVLFETEYLGMEVFVYGVEF